MAKKQVNVDLFGQPVGIDALKKIYIEDISNKPKFKKHLDELNCTFTLEELRPFVSLIRSVFHGCICYDKDTKTAIRCMNDLEHLRLKKDFLIVAANILYSKTNFSYLYDSLDDKTHRMIEYLFFKGYSSADDLNADTGFEWVYKQETRYRYTEYRMAQIPEASLIETFGYSGWSFNRSYSYTLRDMFWRIFSVQVMPNTYAKQLSSEGMEKLPSTEVPLKVYNNEGMMCDFIPVLQQIAKHEKIDYGVKKMSVATVKKIAKKIAFMDFFDKPVLKEQATLASSLAIPMLLLCLSHEKESVVEYWTFLRDMFQNASKRYVLFDMLGHLKGLRRDFVIDNMRYDAFENILISVLSGIHSHRWYSVDDLLIRMFAQPEATKGVMFPLSPNAIDRYDITVANEVTMKPYHVEEYITRPLLYGYLALCAGCGLIEVACQQSDAYRVTPYEVIKYVRLTPLGEYVFGVTDTYKSAEIHTSYEYFDVDTDRLIIRTIDIDGKNPYEGLLSGFAERISKQRYRVTPATFLTGSTGISDIIAKTKYFEDNICKEPSAVWNDFFRQMEKRCNPLQYTSEPYSVYRVSSENKELLQLFVSDNYLRKHSLRAENYTILIETRFLQKVMEKLRAYGYIL